MFDNSDSFVKNDAVFDKENIEVISQIFQPLICKIFAKYKHFDDQIKPFRRFLLEGISKVYNYVKLSVHSLKTI